MSDGILLHLGLISISVVAHGDETKLFAPITQVVERDDFPATCAVEVVEEGANNSGTKMTDVELFGNVGRAVF
jgi:hypothetical protein